MPNPKISPERERQIVACLKSGRPIAEIINEVKVSTKTLYRIANEHNIKRYEKHEKVEAIKVECSRQSFKSSNCSEHFIYNCF